MGKEDPSSGNFPRKFGKYHLLAPLAQGGMGALYLAVTGDRGLERQLVIKTILPHLADAEYLGRFRDEAKVVVQLSHGNLIPVFDAGQVDGEIFLAMDFIEGKDLRVVWNRCAKKAVAFPVDVAVYVVKELCRGLDYAHSFGDLHLVHRDVSPPNILISYSGEVKLTDWGLASSRLKLERTAPGIIYGKVAYMSPEQARGESLDGTSDLYAAGIILWELLTGRQLFPPGKDQPQDLVSRAKNPVVQPPSQRAPRVPPELDAICLKALAPRREDRYQRGEDFRRALAEWLAQKSPGTDSVRLESFLHQLFDEDIQREREQRVALIEKTRERIATLPPTHELRQMLQASGDANLDLGKVAAAENHRAVDRRRVTGGPNFKRRESDRGGDGERRAPSHGRRATDRPMGKRGGLDRTDRGVAVDVPKPGKGGRTVVSPTADTETVSVRSRAAAVAQAAELELEPTDTSDILGQELDGRYRIVELIGEGGMGRVFMAEHVEIGKRVAVKVLHPVYGRMPELVERFRREARAASKIGHPHIVDVTDSGTTADGSVYFVMEHLEGVELAHVIDREGALDVTRALKIATQICRALSAAHAADIIHRDLKPENVFLTVREGTSDFVKVLDFGIAKSGGAEETRNKRLTHPGMAMGTPEYMAPEQAAGKPADERCDIYAVGAILYEMVTGVPPYDGDNFMEILTKKATVEPALPSELRPDVPVVVDELVLHAMARSPGDRPPSMEAFEYELTKCLSGRGAAVAQMLGMPMDPGLIASLNPGMPGMADEGADSNRRNTPLGIDRQRFGTPTPMPRRSSTAGLGSAPDLDVPVPATPETPIQDTSVIVRTGGDVMRAVGWALFALFLLGGAGGLYYVIQGEPGNSAPAAASTVPAEPPPAPAPTTGDGVARGDALVTDGDGAEPEKAAGEGEAAAGEGAATDEGDAAGEGGAEGASDEAAGDEGGAEGASAEGASDEVAGDDGAAEADGQTADTPPADKSKAVTRAKPAAAAPPPQPKAADKQRPPRTAREARRALVAAKRALNKGNWAVARAGFRRVASGRFFRAEANLGLARVAFENKQMDEAIEYAKKAGKGAAARKLLGHAYLKSGRYQRALHEYEAVLKKRPNDEEARRSAKYARQKLK